MATDKCQLLKCHLCGAVIDEMQHTYHYVNNETVCGYCVDEALGNARDFYAAIPKPTLWSKVRDFFGFLKFLRKGNLR